MPRFPLAASQSSPVQTELARTCLEAVALGRDGRPVDTLRPQDVTVTIDGAPG